MKSHKIYYVPGMISLILLPILCVLYLNEHKNIERCLGIQLAVKYHPHKSECFVPFDTSALSAPQNKRNFTEIRLCGNEVEDKIKLDSFNSGVLKAIRDNDTINGFHITFGDNVKYSNYIRAFDICQLDSLLPTYLPFENNLWYFHSQFIKKNKEELIIRQKKITKSRLINEELNYNNLHFTERNKNALKLWPFFLILILFSIISIRYIRNNYIKTNHKQ